MGVEETSSCPHWILIRESSRPPWAVWVRIWQCAGRGVCRTLFTRLPGKLSLLSVIASEEIKKWELVPINNSEDWEETYAAFCNCEVLVTSSAMKQQFSYLRIRMNLYFGILNWGICVINRYENANTRILRLSNSECCSCIPRSSS